MQVLVCRVNVAFFGNDLNVYGCCNYSMAGDHEKLVQEYQQMNKKAFVVGYTGAIGSELVKALLESHIFAKVVLIGRRTVTYEDELYKDVVNHVPVCSIIIVIIIQRILRYHTECQFLA